MRSSVTLGPWSYDGHGINATAEPHKGERIFKTCLDYSHGSADRERAIADSNLVVSAPELLDTVIELVAAARAVIAAWESGDLAGAVNGLDAAADDAEAVIAKAEGRE